MLKLCTPLFAPASATTLQPKFCSLMQFQYHTQPVTPSNLVTGRVWCSGFPRSILMLREHNPTCGTVPQAGPPCRGPNRTPARQGPHAACAGAASRWRSYRRCRLERLDGASLAPLKPCWPASGHCSRRRRDVNGCVMVSSPSAGWLQTPLLWLDSLELLQVDQQLCLPVQQLLPHDLEAHGAGPVLRHALPVGCQLPP